MEREPADHRHRDARGSRALLRELFEAVPVDGDERELGRDEERRGEDQQQDGQKAEERLDRSGSIRGSRSFRETVPRSVA
jgi:hypothetical protein